MARDTPFFIVVPVNPEGSQTDCPAIRELAANVRASLLENEISRETVRFLDFVAAGKGIECGGKGHLLTWGYVANYGDAARTAFELMPFWDGLYGLPSGEGMSWYERALVVSQDWENMPVAVQVRLDEDTRLIAMSKVMLPVALVEM